NPIAIPRPKSFHAANARPAHWFRASGGDGAGCAHHSAPAAGSGWNGGWAMRWLGVAAAIFLAGAAQAQTPPPAYEAVDPFIGTLGKGHTFPGAVAPFGMVQLSPDTDYRHFRQSYDWA